MADGWQRLLVAVDFSDLTGRLLDQAIALARCGGGSLRLLHGEPPRAGYAYYPVGVGYDGLLGFGMDPMLDEEVRSVQLEHDREALDRLEARCGDAGVAVESRLLEGDVAELLLHEAADWPADLLVMGNHRHGMLHRLFTGAVEDRLLRHCPCPVLVVPGPAGG